MVNKKAQMKIQQMAFMLIAVMMFFALVGLLIITVKFSGMKEKATELDKENAMLLVTKIANSPEFSCGNALGSGVSCIDSDKVMILKNKIENYKGFWGDVSGIKIRKINSSGVICELGANYPDCDVIEILPGEGSFIDNFVVLCRKEESYDKCELAKILISYKEVQ